MPSSRLVVLRLNTELATDLTDVAKATDVMKETEKVNDEKVLDRTIEELDLPVPPHSNCLKRRYNTVRDDRKKLSLK